MSASHCEPVDFFCTLIILRYLLAIEAHGAGVCAFSPSLLSPHKSMITEEVVSCYGAIKQIFMGVYIFQSVCILLSKLGCLHGGAIVSTITSQQAGPEGRGTCAC